MKKIAVILSGCGVYDGSEIHESVITLLALDRAGAQAVCTAPDIPQKDIINHLNGKPLIDQTRHIILEAARIARGKITPIEFLKPEELDGAIMPGGLGVAKNLSNFAEKGINCEVHYQVANFLKRLHEDGKPLGFICIAPVIAARLFGHEGIKLTIGWDKVTAQAIEQTGAKHVTATARDVVVDKEHKILSTPAYMLAQRISEVEVGITKLVEELLKLA